MTKENTKISVKYYSNIALVAMLLVLIFFREPLYFFEPRLWAEEGTVHVASIFSNGILKSLVLPHLGYYSLFNNITVALGIGLLGISGVAYITTFFSMIVIVMTIMSPLILTSKYWDSNIKKALIALFTLIIGSGEIWLNTINAQFYFCAFCAFLLLSETKNIEGWKKVYVLTLLSIGALTGVTTIVLLPFFIIKFLKEKEHSSIDKLILIILIIGSAAQIIAFIYTKIFFDTGRLDLLNIKNFPAGFERNFSTYMSFPGVVVKIALFPLVAFFIFFKKIRTWEMLLPLLICLYLCGVFAFLSLGMMGGERYGFAPSVLLFIFFINLVFFNDLNKLIRVIASILVIVSIYGGFESFFKTKNYYDHDWVRFSEKNIRPASYGEYSLPLFPQWPNSNWELRFTEKDLLKYK